MSPKAFTKQERLAIRETLHQKGRELMEQLGIRKTTVEDITRAAGISKGSFYLFYDCKEGLFLDILDTADKEIRQALWEGLSTDEVDKRKQFKDAFRNVLRMMDHMPMLAKLNSEEFQYLYRKLPPDLSEEQHSNDHDVIEDFIGQLVQHGKIRNNVDLKVAVGLFRAISLTILQKEEIGAQVFDEVLEKILDGAIAYLINE